MGATLKVKSIKDGSIYFLRKEKIDKEAGDWEIVVEKVASAEDVGYAEIKAELTEMGVKFKGNASKENLKMLLDLEKDSLN